MDNEKKIEIPFGAFDSELIHQEINIPNGFKATIEGDKIILTRAEREDEKVRKALAEMVHDTTGDSLWVDYNVHKEEALAWLEKQGEEQPIIRWHSINEEPEEMKELFCEWESDDATWHDVAFYDKESHTFRHAKMPINVTKWVYVDELLEEQAEVVSDKDDIEAEEEGIREAFNKIEDEKQCKQKPQRMISAEAKEAMYDKSADKVEPKFKVGDSIKTANEEPLTITEITDNGYWSEDLFICNFDDAAKWELVEQKPADKVEPKCDESETKIFDAPTPFEDKLYAFVAACEFLAIPSKIEFILEHSQEILDAAREQIGKEQSSAWSEEDEEMFDGVIADIQFSQKAHNHEVDQIVYEREIDWLKSLKERIGG